MGGGGAFLDFRVQAVIDWRQPIGCDRVTP